MMEADSIEKIPDQNQEAEDSVLGAILIDPAAIGRVAGLLKPEHFYQQSRQSIYRAALTLHQNSQSVDFVTVTDELRAQGNLEDAGGVELLYQLMDAVTGSSQMEVHAELVIKSATKRKARELLLRRITALSNPATDVESLLVDTRNDLADLSLDYVSRRGRDIKSDADSIDGYVADLEKRQGDRDVFGLQTGFEHMDELINGLQSGLIILAGSPGCGKTTFCKQVADEVAKLNKVPVLFFAFDESGEVQRLKTLSRLSEVPMRQIKKGRTQGEQWERVRRCIDGYKQTFGHLVHVVSGTQSHGMTPQRIRLEAESLKRKMEADRILLVIDYLQLVPVADPRQYGSDKERVDAICKELCNVSEDLDCPILAISQQSRGGYGEKRGTPKVGDLTYYKESGGIEYSAFQAMELWTDREQTQTLRDGGNEKDRVIRLFIHKNRDGDLGEVTLLYTPDIATFREKTDGDDITPWPRDGGDKMVDLPDCPF